MMDEVERIRLELAAEATAYKAYLDELKHRTELYHERVKVSLLLGSNVCCGSCMLVGVVVCGSLLFCVPHEFSFSLVAHCFAGFD
jgi:hypothetical protein